MELFRDTDVYIIKEVNFAHAYCGFHFTEINLKHFSPFFKNAKLVDEKLKYFSKILPLYVHLGLKFLVTIASIWSKTILNKGSFSIMSMALSTEHILRNF